MCPFTVVGMNARDISAEELTLWNGTNSVSVEFILHETVQLVVDMFGKTGFTAAGMDAREQPDRI